MNGYERLTALLANVPIDRLAYLPITMMIAADIHGVAYGDYVQDYRLLVDAQIQTARELGADHVSVISDPCREAADFGANIIYYDNQPPAIDETNPYLADKTRIATIPELDPLRPNSRMRDRIDAISLFRKKVGGTYFIEGWVEGPCAEAADLRGINHLMMDIVEDKVFVVDLFEKCIHNAIRFAQEQIQAGADIIGIGDAAASLVGPRRYRELVYPYELKLVRAIQNAGGRVRLHICGNISRSLDVVGMLGADLVDLDSMVPIDLAREKMGPTQILTGNIDPVRILRNGTPQDIITALQKCHKDAGERYIVGAGCEIPRGTPNENLKAIQTFIEHLV